ncbi:MAG TPA: helix-turn-helix transcriptional regulator [Gemmatimonadales bacterium]|nr:helix-turn-helix transcriptional regulator [Gemmatimonadales bacterium]
MRHLILAAVAPERVGRLQGGAAGHFDVVAARRWAEAFELIRARPVAMAVVDPTLSGEPRSHEIERLRLLFPSLPLLVYTALEPSTAGVLLTLGRSGVKRAVFHPFEDSPAALRAAIAAELEQSASQQVLQSMAGVLAGLPERVRTGLAEMLGVGVGACTVADLAGRVDVERRTCERWFLRAGLPSPKAVMMVLRLLYAHRLLLDPGATVEDVALKLGYGKVKTMQAHCREVFGLTAGELRISLSIEEAVAVATERYFAKRSGAEWAAS